MPSENAFALAASKYVLDVFTSSYNNIKIANYNLLFKHKNTRNTMCFVFCVAEQGRQCIGMNF